MQYKVGDILEGKVIDFGNSGEGIVKIDAFPIFIPFAIKGESVKFKLNYVKKDYAFADIIEVLNPSKDRIKPLCTYYSKCGGCDMQHISMELQLEIKRQNVKNILKKNAGVDIDVPLPIHVDDFEYRNKLALPFGYNEKSKKVSLGFYEKKSHDVVSMKWCPLHGEWAATLIKIVQEWANKFNVSVYNEKTGKGLLRHLVARNISTLSVTLVINGNSVPNLEDLCASLNEQFKDVEVYISTNKESTNVILGDNIKLVYGKKQKQDLGAFSAYVSPLSFLQVNNKVKDLIYDYVCDNLKDYKGNIIELYSGVGLLTAQIATRLDKASITSVEIVKEAVEDANNLMKDLGIDNRVRCICDDATNYFKKISNTENNALILDPPRKGCSQEIVELINNNHFDTIIYISCNPATLARDYSGLKEKYEIKEIKLFDMFPQTSHVETVCVLESVKC